MIGCFDHALPAMGRCNRRRQIACTYLFKKQTASGGIVIRMRFLSITIRLNTDPTSVRKPQQNTYIIIVVCSKSALRSTEWRSRLSDPILALPI